mmetsp:Transcript_9655/g.15382  ORF Transcript_9655/g.15382 Transcript_9655/m.15382 type:complete len:172 (-) Transcript_9655:12-527(-)
MSWKGSSKSGSDDVGSLMTLLQSLSGSQSSNSQSQGSDAAEVMTMMMQQMEPDAQAQLLAQMMQTMATQNGGSQNSITPLRKPNSITPVRKPFLKKTPPTKPADLEDDKTWKWDPELRKGSPFDPDLNMAGMPGPKGEAPSSGRWHFKSQGAKEPMKWKWKPHDGKWRPSV